MGTIQLIKPKEYYISFQQHVKTLTQKSTKLVND